MHNKLFDGAIVLSMAVFAGGSAFASLPRQAAGTHVAKAVDQVTVVAERSSSKGRPPGWSKGEKTGWGSGRRPPGQGY